MAQTTKILKDRVKELLEMENRLLEQNHTSNWEEFWCDNQIQGSQTKTFYNDYFYIQNCSHSFLKLTEKTDKKGYKSYTNKNKTENQSENQSESRFEKKLRHKNLN